jgi:hypothetical protein
VANLHTDARWWYMPCHQAIKFLVIATVVNLALYLARVPSIKPWVGWDAVLYGLQAWYVLLLIGFQWCALGGLKRHARICSRVTASPGQFFLEEAISLASNFLAVLLMAVFLNLHWIALLKPCLEHTQPELPTGCRLSWQAAPDSWYSCSLLANVTTHQRINFSLVCLSIGAASSLISAFACYCTAIAGPQNPQRTWFEWARHALSAVMQGLFRISTSMCQALVLRPAEPLHEAQPVDLENPAQQALQSTVHTVSELRIAIGDLRNSPPLQVQAALPALEECVAQVHQELVAVQQKLQDADQQDADHAPDLQLQREQLYENAAFAEHWWWHTAYTYTGMCFHCAYCMTVVMLEGLQIGPLNAQCKGLCNPDMWVGGIAAVLGVVRIYHGMMAWRTIELVREHAD